MQTALSSLSQSSFFGADGLDDRVGDFTTYLFMANSENRYKYEAYIKAPAIKLDMSLWHDFLLKKVKYQAEQHTPVPTNIWAIWESVISTAGNDLGHILSACKQ